MYKIKTPSLSRMFKKSVCTVLIFSFLSLSAPAAPEEITGTAVKSWQDLRFRFLSSQLAIDGPGWLAAFFAAGGKNGSVSREIERIEIFPGLITLETGREAVFSAVAFDRNNEPLSGVNFTWSGAEAASGRPFYGVRGGVFKARGLGAFRVKAQAAGREAS